MQKINFQDLGLIDYQQCWAYQEKLMKEVVDLKLTNRELPDAEKLPAVHHLLFCEHPHVYTLGKSGSQENLLIDNEQLKTKEATFYKINRGGDITYHGPGQLVGYPILDMDYFFNDIHKYMRYLEEVIILTLQDYGIEAGRIEGLTGVWLDINNPAKARKICAFGVHLSRWVTMHGWAFNVNCDLDYFKNIVPCGINDKAVTSLQQELGYAVNMEEVKQKVKANFEKIFEVSCN